MDRLKDIEQKGLKPDTTFFEIGDTVSVGLLITEGDKERTQYFTGTVIRRKGSGIRETFTVRRIVQGEGVERVFPLHSPKITEIKVTRKGKIRRAKLYYLRDRTGKATKVEERIIRKRDKKKNEAEPAPPPPSEEG